MDISYREIYMLNREAARKQIVNSYLALGNISEVARLWHTSRNVVRKWVKRFEERGEGGLKDKSKRPHSSPRKISNEVEQKVLEARKKTGYGRKRLAWYLAREEGIVLSPNTIRHVLGRNGFKGKRKPRKVFYPAFWVWETEKPFSLVQADTKDILDKGTLGTRLWTHMLRKRLPRYQWTCLEGKTRLRFLSYSRELSLASGLCFMFLVMLWLRRYGMDSEVVWQTDWGEEFGGSNPEKLTMLEERYYQPLGAHLARIPKGRKGYSGRVERSHRSDDEELYLPFLGSIWSEQDFLRKALGWVYFYNLVRPHYGKDMNGKTPFEKLRELGYGLPEEFALFPPIILDTISTDWLLETGNDLLAHYNPRAQKFVTRWQPSFGWALMGMLHGGRN
ncbi:MAG: helix-turn-helix domain-containing protein [Candidatus Bathyarchaeota archaeon]|nr:helix-turn-helix domain-containing protein [Candidatus Bathyarchaeota archaeon]